MALSDWRKKPNFAQNFKTMSTIAHSIDFSLPYKVKDISLAEWIICVSANGNDPVAVDLDRDAAGGFAEGAGQKMQR